MFSQKNSWDDKTTGRIQLAVEEIILGLTEIRQGSENDPPAKFRIELRVVDDHLEMDMAVSAIDDNIEVFIDAARLSKQVPMGQWSFKILSNIADEIRHYQFHGLDFICLKIKV